jgi:hypothetical protein
VPCDGAYGVDDYVRTIKEYEQALEYFDTALYDALNVQGVTGGRIELPPHLGGFVFTFTTEYEGDSQ